MSAKIVSLGAHDRMTPEETLALVSREQWDSVLVCGFHSGSTALVIRSSAMSREEALWLVEHTKLAVLDKL